MGPNAGNVLAHPGNDGNASLAAAATAGNGGVANAKGDDLQGIEAAVNAVNACLGLPPYVGPYGGPYIYRSIREREGYRERGRERGTPGGTPPPEALPPLPDTDHHIPGGRL